MSEDTATTSTTEATSASVGASLDTSNADSNTLQADSGLPEQAPEQTTEQAQTEQAPVQTGQTEQTGSDKQEQAVDPLDVPIKEWGKVKLTLPKDAQINQEAYDSFGAIAEGCGLTQRQAEKLVEWQLTYVSEAQKALFSHEMDSLKKAWGADFKKNETKVLALVSQLDRTLGENRFSKAMAACGANNLADVQIALLAISDAMSEDSIGSHSGVGKSVEEDAFSGLKNALQEQLNRRLS